jgi:hypothetical protein
MMAQQPEALPERRLEARRPVHIVARLQCHRLSRPAVIVDYSRGGLRVDSNLAVVIGECATVELPAGHQLPVQVVWVVGGHIGVRFMAAMQDGHPAMQALGDAARECERLNPPDAAA